MKKTVFFLFILFFPLNKSFACSCAETNESLSKKVNKAYKASTLIITGKVINVKHTNSGLIKSSAAPVIYTFEVISTLKGELKKATVEILSAESSASCGYKFELGKTYLVYANTSNHFSSQTNKKSHFITGLCNRNEKLKKVKKKELRKLKRFNCREKRN